MNIEKYDIRFTETSLKRLKSFNTKDVSRIFSKIEKLKDSPFQVKNVKKLVDFDISYSLRTGNYRVLFERDDKIRIIDIINIRHRKESYRRK